LENRFKFDPTINLGHIITFIGFIITCFTIYQSLDKRVAMLEENKKTQELKDQFQDAQNAVQTTHISSTLTEIKRSIDKMDNKLEAIRYQK
jgi:uncharacterized coiled-coil protein SlyX